MKRVLIVGAGITGLIAGLKLHKSFKVTFAEAGPDPRFNKNTYGATYSGSDARHISYTETAPWNSKYRHKLITISSKNGGWLCAKLADLKDIENQWIEEFQAAASDESSYKKNTLLVINLNKKGVAAWSKLEKEFDFIKPVVDTGVMPIICRTKNDLIDEYNFEHSLDGNCKLYEEKVLPDSLRPLQPGLKKLGNPGYFTLQGKSYQSKKICNDLINHLESSGASFLWNRCIAHQKDLEKEEHAPEFVVWTSGTSYESAMFLKNFNILLQGVVGCWIEMENPGIKIPCKIFGPEPVNYINLTPCGNKLLMSGGYGFVGLSSYTEAVDIAEPIMEAMEKEVKNWLPQSEIVDTAFCIRPALPTGVPALITGNLDSGIPIIIAVGHAAGGFTQASHTAELIYEKLKNG